MEAVLLSIIAYISTNIDDLFINMIFFAQADNVRETRSVIVGKFLGIGMLTAASMLGARGLQMLPSRWVSLLGFVPIALGLWNIFLHIRNAKEETDTPYAAKKLWLSMAVTTIASGADNVGVYVPLFSCFNPWQLLVSAAVFLLMTALWCLISKRLVDLPGLRNMLVRYKTVVIPIVYILLGLCILI